jgi:hypothetical protein
VMLGRSQGRTVAEVTGRVVEEPILARLIASNHRVIGMLGVGRGMLTGRRVAATNVTARRAAPQVEPPPSGLETVGASIATGRDAWIDRVIHHGARISDGRRQSIGWSDGFFGPAAPVVLRGSTPDPAYHSGACHRFRDVGGPTLGVQRSCRAGGAPRSSDLRGGLVLGASSA